jgi:hypothetical protein
MGSTLVGCYPTYGYGAVLAPRAPTMDWHLAEPYRYHATSGAETLFPEGAWVAQAETGGGLLLTVVTESRATTEQVIGSLRTD